MPVPLIVLGIISLVFAVLIVLVVLLQDGGEQNLGSLSGSADTFFTKNQGRSIDAFLERWTRVIAIGFFLLVIAMNVAAFFMIKTGS